MKTKKELKDAYKQMEFPMGVFQIRCTANGRLLVDHSTDMASKWNRHLMELKFGNHRNRGLQQDWKQYGETSFVFEVLSQLQKTEEPATNYNKELKELQALVLEELPTQNLY